MALYFADSSALAKRYVDEQGSIWMRAILEAADTDGLYIARITLVELVSSVYRRVRTGNVSPEHALELAMAIRGHYLSEYISVDINDALIIQASELAQKHNLRGYDAVQLAAALRSNQNAPATIGPVILLSADLDLNAAALDEGLLVQDPNLH